MFEKNIVLIKIIFYLDINYISFLNAVMHHAFLRGYFNNVTKNIKKYIFLTIMK